MVSSKPTKVVVVPNHSPIDKLIAFMRVQLDLRNRFNLIVRFCDVNIPTPAHYAEWEALCSPGVDPYLIDVGDKKYHLIAGSAAEVEKMSSETTNGRTWNRLAALANENNQTGCLKQARYSIAGAIREIYKIAGSDHIRQGVVFDHGMDVVKGYFLPQNKRAWADLFEKSEYAELRSLFEGFGVQGSELCDFTLPQYFRHLFMSGRSEAEIIRSIGWWTKRIDQVDKDKEASKLLKFRPRFFTVAGKQAVICTVDNTVNAFASKSFTYQYIGSGKAAIGIIRNERGQVFIQSSFRHPGVNFTKLFAFLDKLEPGQWYLETRFPGGPMIMNGSDQFTGVRATRLTDEQLVQAAQRLVTFDAPLQ